MPPVVWNAAKAKVQIRLSIQRLRTLQQKKEAQAKTARRDIATLLERGKVETAKIKVETIIHEDIHIELLELLEFYYPLPEAKLVSVREPDPGVADAVASVIHTAPRTELKELHILREILMQKYGREYSVNVMENRDGIVNERVMRKLATETPPSDLVDAYMVEIAKGYNVPWAPLPRSADATSEKEEGTEPLLEKEGEVAQAPTSTESAISGEGTTNTDDNSKKETSPSSSLKSPTTAPLAQEDDFDTLLKRFAALKKR